jgi:hypothetical protein
MATSRSLYEATERVLPRGLISAFIAFAAAMEGDEETARQRMRSLLTDDLEPLRRPDGHVPAALWALALTATIVGDREAGDRLRQLLEPMRHYVISAAPAVAFGQLPEWHIGRLELLADRPGAAVRELRPAVERADAYELVLASGLARADLATALHRHGDAGEATRMLSEAESIAERYGLGWVVRTAAEARAEMEGLELESRTPAAERSRPIRALCLAGRPPRAGGDGGRPR